MGDGAPDRNACRLRGARQGSGRDRGNQAIAESGAAAQVAQLTPEQRNGVFEKAIRDSGVACPAVTGSERTEIRPGVKGWKAQCDNDSAHLIEITPDGTAKVTSRTY